MVLDAPLEIINADGSTWRPDNYEGDFDGPQTLRRGIERSRNVMTVRLAQDVGMPMIQEYAKTFGIYDNLMPVLAMALGAGETTDMKMTAAYATIANGGRKIVPTLIDRIQDRYGNTIYKHDERVCDGCVATAWENQPEPLIIDNREQVLDPMTAYQITSMMEGGAARQRYLRQEAQSPGGWQDRHHQRLSRCVVPRLHAGTGNGRLYRLRQAQEHGKDGNRRRSRRADFHRVHGRCAEG